MKVLILNGSPKKNGNTSIAIGEMVKVFDGEGIETEIVDIGTTDVRGCIGCGSCSGTGKCVFDDIVNQVAKKFEEADGLVLASPVYYSSPNGSLISLCDRLFYSTHFDKSFKVGASVVVARRGGSSASFDVLNKYFSISNMVIATSQYWNMVYGAAPGEANEDLEGLQTMRTLAQNMSFLMKSIALGKEKYGLPEREKEMARTNFVR
ncbi:MAG: flavodoxin family protein [Lachnospiraceae bacterium]|nr:flavodoxin family protein [Lachnospiraceae bacterium]